MARVLLPVVCVLGFAFAPTTARAAGDRECMAAVPERSGDTAKLGLSGQTTRVFVNRAGGGVVAGRDDASRRTSEVLAGRGVGAIDVPAWSRGAASWSSLVGCVQAHFADYQVEIVDEEPTSGSYIMAMVGGEPSMLGLGRSVGGIAPYNGRVIDDAIVFVFEENIASARGQCEATVHEIGHALGLDHSTECRDVMSYESCGPKAFTDTSAACGEYAERTCSDGQAEQNSHALLARTVGLRDDRPSPASRPASPAPPAPQRASPPAIARRLPGASNNSAEAPRVQIAHAAQRQRADSRYVVTLRARDTDGIARVELFWTDGRAAYRLQCGRAHPALPVHCARHGDTYTFALDVGRGDRAFAVRVTDGRGLSSVTRPRAVRFD